ncbi:MAG: hypothetical protein P8X58_02355 [Syntrophobacterales bacterium]
MKFIGEQEKLQPLSMLFYKFSFSILRRVNFRRLFNIIYLLAELKIKRKKLKYRHIIAKINTFPRIPCSGVTLGGWLFGESFPWDN